MLRDIIIAILLVINPIICTAQQKDSCKVLLPEIAGNYTGKCLNGLAHGKGKAVGTDTYEGIFSHGLPDGKGKYTFNNGNIYQGYWKNGVMEGRGKLTLFVNEKKQVQRGYWKNGEYVGTTDPDICYRITSHTGITQYAINRVADSGSLVTVKFTGGLTRYIPRDLKVIVSSGHKDVTNKSVIVYSFNLPLNCSIHFTVPGGIQNSECFLLFDILKPGKYEVSLSVD